MRTKCVSKSDSKLNGTTSDLIHPQDLKTARQSLGLSQRQLANAVGISQATLSRIERGNSDIKLSVLELIVTVLKPQTKSPETVITAKDIMQKIPKLDPDLSVRQAVRFMHRKSNYSWCIFKNGKCIGAIFGVPIIRQIASGTNVAELLLTPIRKVMVDPPPVISPSATLQQVCYILQDHPSVLVASMGDLVGMITRYDLIELLVSRAVTSWESEASSEKEKKGI